MFVNGSFVNSRYLEIKIMLSCAHVKCLSNLLFLPICEDLSRELGFNP